ncbi:PREDICTED: meiosis-specific protein MEI4-like [Gavialis gangeticus]|uniref:meiosis-specific protein MEI4-like n=1 Tax=Gavialis gangeticus TaxID=94835 RepID=UPI00092F7FBC|nr:PREDICTED: meiosis-specific protein MEI4-like [Gavialis gangeticus]
MEAGGGAGAAGIKERREDQVWYLKISKLALALAIIHSKPPEKSCKEYTEQLAKILSEQDFNWRSKIKTLEAEVLRLRQEILLNKICPRLCLENGNPDAFTEMSPDQEFINSINPSQLEDSGCDISSDYAFDTLDISPTFLYSELSCNTSSSKFCSEILPKLTPYCTDKEKTLTAHMQFLQHLLGLRKLTEPGSFQADFTEFENNYSTVSESVSQLLEGLIIYCNSPKLPVTHFMTEAICVLSSLITDSKLSNHVLKKCFKKLHEFKKQLIQIILSNNNINRVSLSTCYHEYPNIQFRITALSIGSF